MKKIIFYVLTFLSIACSDAQINKKKAFLILNSSTETLEYPQTIQNITAWWDNGSDYMAADGSVWIDRIGGYNLSQSNASFRPVYTTGELNGRASFVFDATNDFLETSGAITAINGASKMTLWAVGKYFQIGQDDGGTTNRNNFGYSTADNKVYGVPNGSTNYGYSAAQAAGFYYMQMVFDGTQTGNANRLKLFVNGVQVSMTFAGTIGTTTNASGLKFFLGKYSSLYQAARLLEVGIVADALSADQLEDLNKYLGPKYGFQNVYFFGNSITFGYGATIVENRWTTLLSRAKGWNEINKSISGTPLMSSTPVISGNFYDNRNDWIPYKTANDKYLIFNYGVNDCGYNNGNYTTALFKTQYQTIIDLCFARGWSASDIFIQLGFYQNGWSNPWGGVTVTTADATRYAAFITAASEVASDNSITFIDQTGQYGAGSTIDNIHPNNAGYLAIKNYAATLIP